MSNLITRLQAATGPDRELDAEIFLLQWPGYRLQTDCEPFPDQVQPGRIQEIGGFAHRTAPTFTASIDAALTLVPEGYWWNVGHVMGPQPDTQNLFWAMCHMKGEKWPYDRPIAATPALAICIAALCARGEP